MNNSATHLAASGLARTAGAALAALMITALVACGGRADPPQPIDSVIPNPPPVATAPTVTPVANQTVPVGQTATFAESASGTDPLSYQWQKNGVTIEGAIGASYTTPATVAGDDGSTFTVAVSNSAGSASTTPATLTVTVPPTLTVTQDPASLTVASGATATFTVAATCSAGNVTWTWQRSADGGATYNNITGATMASYSLVTAGSDNAAQFHAIATCGNLTQTTTAATLTVTSPTAPTSVTLEYLPIVGLAPQVFLANVPAIVHDPSGSYTFINSNQIQRLSADLTTVSIVAGQDPLMAQSSGSADGVGTAASFNRPQSLTEDAAGNIYVADTQNYTIRRIAPNGTVSTLAGTAGSFGTTDGTGAAARFNQMNGIAIGPDGDLYVADTGNNSIRRVTVAGVVTTYAGGMQGYADGTPSAAMFLSPNALSVASNGDVFVSDQATRIRRIVRSGNTASSVETFAGNGQPQGDDSDGIGTAASILVPGDMVVVGNILTVRDNLGLLRQIDLTTKAVTTLAGSRSLGAGYRDGPLGSGRLGMQGGLATAANNGFFATDDRTLRAIDSTGLITTVATTSVYNTTTPGFATLSQLPFVTLGDDVPGLEAVAVDSAGNVDVFEKLSNLLRRISPTGVVTLAAGLSGGSNGVVDGIGSAAEFAVGFNAYLASDNAGNLYSSDLYGVRKVTMNDSVTLLTGSRTDQGAVDGSATTSRFMNISGIAVKTGGDVYVSDNHAVRRIDAAGNVTTYAGVLGQSGEIDGATATARFNGPGLLAFAPDGSLLVIDTLAATQQAVLRKISADGSIVSTVALPAGTSVSALAIDNTGTLYYGNDIPTGQGGLYVMPAGGQPSLLIPEAAYVNVGANPAVAAIQQIAIIDLKHLVIDSNQALLEAILP